MNLYNIISKIEVKIRKSGGRKGRRKKLEIMKTKRVIEIKCHLSLSFLSSFIPRKPTNPLER